MEDNVEKNEAAKQQIAPEREAVTEGDAEHGGAGENAADGSQKSEGQNAAQAAAPAKQPEEPAVEGSVSELPYVGQTIEGKGVVYAVKRVLGDTFIKISNDAADWQQI